MPKPRQNGAEQSGVKTQRDPQWSQGERKQWKVLQIGLQGDPLSDQGDVTQAGTPWRLSSSRYHGRPGPVLWRSPLHTLGCHHQCLQFSALGFLWPQRKLSEQEVLGFTPQEQPSANNSFNLPPMCDSETLSPQKSLFCEFETNLL